MWSSKQAKRSAKMSFHITHAAAMINEVDPALASAFLAQPFRRSMMVEALRASMKRSTLADIADSLCGRIIARIEMDKELREAA